MHATSIRPGATSGAVLLSMMLVLVVGCGDSPQATEDGSKIVAALSAVQDRARQGDFNGVCASLSHSARSRYAKVDGRTCASGLATLLRARRPPRQVGRPDVVGTRIEAERATATLALTSRLRGEVGLTRQDGRWLLDDLRVTPSRSAVAAPELGYGAWREGRRRRPCPPVDGMGGGCVSRVERASTDVQLLSVLGKVSIARCRFGYRLHVGDPIYLADRVRFTGPDPCDRIDRCVDGETGLRYPWLGNGLRTSAPNVVKVYFDVCINTPVGRARGFLLTRFERAADDWRAETYDAPIGTSGFQMTGTWDVAPDDFRIGDLPTRP
jgi:hypothetical protein